jgi:hypothetical protein
MITYEIIFINKKIHALGNPELSLSSACYALNPFLIEIPCSVAIYL